MNEKKAKRQEIEMPVTLISQKKSMTPSQTIWALNMLPAVGMAAEKPEKLAQAWPSCSVKEMKHAPPVRLMEATQMYQPVSGSSEGSRYFMVAARKDIKLAARYRNNQLSLRLEGDLQKYKSLKGLSDFEIKSDNHASLHASIDDTKLAAKTLGAVMLDLDILFETPIPNFHIIQAAS